MRRKQAQQPNVIIELSIRLHIFCSQVGGMETTPEYMQAAWNGKVTSDCQPFVSFQDEVTHGNDASGATVGTWCLASEPSLFPTSLSLVTP